MAVLPNTIRSIEAQLPVDGIDWDLEGGPVALMLPEGGRRELSARYALVDTRHPLHLRVSPLDGSLDAQPMSAEEAAATMELPPGFKCLVFAAEPDVRQPIAMAWDAKGRLWVAENYTYAENPMRWDTKLRDRVIILEDKDGDGRCDEIKTFYQGRDIDSAHGVCVLGSRIIVSALDNETN